MKEDALESLYEQRLRKKLKEKDDNVLEVDPVDALPVKTSDGKIVFRTGNFNPTFNILVSRNSDVCLFVYVNEGNKLTTTLSSVLFPSN